MWALLLQQQPSAGGQGTSTLQLVLTGIISIVGALATGALAKVGIEWWLRRSTRRKTEAEADKTGAEGVKARAEAQKLVTEGEMAESAGFLAWAETFRAEATEAKAEAKAEVAAARADAAAARADARASEESARAARIDADQCARDRANDREELEDVKRDLQRLYDLIAGCQAGTVCPVADRLTR